MPTSYPAGLDTIPLPDFTSEAPEGSLGQPARPAGEYLTDLTDSVKAVQAALGTSTAPGPLLALAGAGESVLSAPKDGIVDASAAVLAWASGLLALGAAGFAPPGRYLLNSAAAATLNSPKFALRGAGVGLTVWVVPASNTTGGLLFDASGAPRDAEITFSDFSIVTQGVGQGTGLRVVMTPGGAEHHRSVRIDRVHVHGENPDTDCFNIGIDLTATWRPALADVIVGGPFGALVDANQTDASPLYVGSVGIKLDDAYAWSVERSYVWSYYTGYSDIGTNAEGGRLINSHAVGVRVGLDRYRDTPQPGLRVSGCHVNYRDTGLHVVGSKVWWVDHCHIYNQDDTDEYSGVARDVWLQNTEFTNISDNYFWFPGAPDRINVDIDASTLGRFAEIHHNIFGATATNGVRISALANNIEVRDNSFRGTYTKNVQDNSGTATVTSSADGVYRIENQANGPVNGPVQEWYRDSASPAVADSLGRASFLGNDSGGNETEYAAIQAQINDPSSGAENGAISAWVQAAGVLTKVATFQDVGAGDSTSVFIMVVRNGVVGFPRVSLGAVDSGGSGKRVLTVPNS